jgi:hypothetical protein
MKSILSITALLTLTLTLAIGCASRRIDVQQYGKMHDILGGGAAKAAPLVSLSEVLDRPGACGVGALAGLAGEVTIIDGDAWVSQVDGDGLRVEGPLDDASAHQAAMLTVAHVDEWQSVSVPEALAGDELEAFIGRSAGNAGLDATRPFPFVIEGAATDLQLHVICGACPMKPGGRIGDDEAPWRRGFDGPTQTRIVGFYAPDSVGNLTHPGTAIHAHALLTLDGRLITGHVERLGMDTNAVLKIPVVR